MTKWHNMSFNNMSIFWSTKNISKTFMWLRSDLLQLWLRNKNYLFQIMEKLKVERKQCWLSVGNFGYKLCSHSHSHWLFTSPPPNEVFAGCNNVTQLLYFTAMYMYFHAVLWLFASNLNTFFLVERKRCGLVHIRLTSTWVCIRNC